MKRMIGPLLLSGLCWIQWLFCNSLPAQNPPHWRFWLAADGLGESCSNSVYVGASERVWVNHGHIAFMSILDGWRVAQIPSPGIGSPVFENPADHVWSIYEKGFLRFDENSQKWIQHPVAEMQPDIISFFPVQENRLVFLSPERFMEFQIDLAQTRILKKSSETELGRFTALRPSYSGKIWIAAEYGLAEVRPPSMDGLHYEWREFPIPPHLNVQGVNHPVESSDGSVYCSAFSNISSRKILLRFNQNHWVIAYENPAIQIDWGWAAGENAFLITESPLSLWRVESQRIDSIESNKVLSRVLLDVCIEENDSFWLATSEGLARWSPPTWQTPSSFTNLDRVVHSMLEDKKNRLWILCVDRLIGRDDEHLQWKTFPLPPGNDSDELRTEGLVQWDDDRLAIKTINGAILFDARTQQFEILKHPDGHQICTLAAGDSFVWIVSFSGDRIRLEQFDGRSWKTILSQDNFNFLDPDIRHVYQDESQSIWFAGLNGLVRWREGRFHRFRPSDGYTDTAAYCIYPVGGNRLWVGGREALLEFDGDDWRILQTGMDGVRSITQTRDGSLWVASGTGLHRYKNHSWVANTYEDGLPNASIFEVFQDRQDRIWAGAASGLRLYHPGVDNNPPETWFPEEKNFHTFGPSGAQFFYRGMDQWKYTRSNRLLFSHRIDDGDWSPFLSETEQSVSNLPAGPHRFEVRAMDRNWNIDPTPAVYHFTIIPPWHRQPVFLFILGLCALLFLFIIFLIGWIVYSTQQRNRLLARQVAERTADLTRANEQLQQDAHDLKKAYDQVLAYQKQLQSLSWELSRTEERERRRLAADLHDSIGQSLALAVIKLEALQESLFQSEPSPDIEQLKNLIDLTLQNSRSLTVELCPPILYEVGFEAAIEQLTEQIQNQYNLQIDVTIEFDCQRINEDLRYLLFRSLRELLMNVVKHAQSSSVQIRIHEDRKFLVIEVNDRGIGFDPQKLSAQTESFGLFSIGERLKQIGGKIKVESAPGEGSRLTLFAPI
ncbi:MAG: hypothetical protein JXR73_07945 [Candidatus Omnitrophica bacterium]|nr:hypothetical protein [Candidatus Omnitrophota bacterium]